MYNPGLGLVMFEEFADINGIVGVALAAIIGGLFKLWATLRRIKADSERHAADARERAEADVERQRQEWHKELYSEMHLWRNKFQAMDNKLELVRSERETLAEKVKNLQGQIDIQSAELKNRDAKISELERKVVELTRRLAQYEPENIQSE